MLALELLAERRIAEAVSRGELDNLPGAGRPLLANLKIEGRYFRQVARKLARR